MKRKNILIFICIMTITVLSAGILSAYAMPSGQAENPQETTTADTSDTSAAEDESGIELIPREENTADTSAADGENTPGETAEDAADTGNEESAEAETTEEQTEPAVEIPEAPVPEACAYAISIPPSVCAATCIPVAVTLLFDANHA